MSKTSTTALRPNIYQIVTDRIIQSLKAGVIPWGKPWQSPHFSGGPFPRNFLTGKPYSGVNVLLLWSSTYASPFWLTFKQVQELKGTVRKGEKGTQVVLYKQLRSPKEDQAASDAEKERAPFVLCYYTVFNVEQCDGLTLPQIDQPAQSNEVETDEACEAIVTGWANRPALHLTSEHEYRAYYRSSTDSVHMPARARFVDAPHYYSALFHELIHSTGHESRLNRTFGNAFGDELYSREELIAEMGAASVLSGGSTSHGPVAVIQLWNLMTLDCCLCCVLPGSDPPPLVSMPPKSGNPYASQGRPSGTRTIRSGSPRKPYAGPTSSWTISAASIERRLGCPRTLFLAAQCFVR